MMYSGIVDHVFGLLLVPLLRRYAVYPQHVRRCVRVNLRNKLFAYEIASGHCLRLRVYYRSCSLGLMRNGGVCGRATL